MCARSARFLLSAAAYLINNHISPWVSKVKPSREQTKLGDWSVTALSLSITPPSSAAFQRAWHPKLKHPRGNQSSRASVPSFIVAPCAFISNPLRGARGGRRCTAAHYHPHQRDEAATFLEFLFKPRKKMTKKRGDPTHVPVAVSDTSIEIEGLFERAVAVCASGDNYGDDCGEALETALSAHAADRRCSCGRAVSLAASTQITQRPRRQASPPRLLRRIAFPYF